MKELTSEEKIKLINALLKSRDLKYTNSIRKIIIQFLLFYLYEEKQDIIEGGNCEEIIKLFITLQTNNNKDDLTNKAIEKAFLLVFGIKDLSFVYQFFKDNGTEIELFDKKIIKINKNRIDTIL